MKTSVLFVLVLNFSFFFDLKSQADSQLYIEKLEVSYKQADFLEGASTDSVIKYSPQISFQLKNGSGVSKLYCKMIDESSNAVLLDVNYLLNSVPVLDQTGKKVFYKDEQGVYHIRPANRIPLNLYLYQIVTEDSQGNQSPSFSESH